MYSTYTTRASSIFVLPLHMTCMLLCSSTALFLALYPTIIDFLESFKALLCVGGVAKEQGPLIRLADVLVLLPKLRERYYSISSSPLDDPSLVSISVGVTNDFSQSFEVWRPTKGKVKLPTKIGHGSPFAQQYGFGIQWKRKVNATYVANGPSCVDTMDMDEAKAFYAVGPPYIATAKDMYSLTMKWTEFAPRVHDLNPHLLAEMFAYCFAAAHLNLPHRAAHSFMVSDVWSGGEGWKLVDKMGKANVCNPPPDLNPHVINYC
jgi:hypothetical protein